MYRKEKKAAKKEAGDPGAWTVHDRIEEIKGKLTLKQRDQEAYFTFSQQLIKDNEALIRKVRAEIKEKQIQQKQSLNADEHVIRSGFANNRRSQLAMQKYDVATAITEKNEHVFDKVSQLNATRHERQNKIKKLDQLALTLRDLKRLSKTNAEDAISQRVRVLTTSLDKMQMKCSSCRFIQKTYRQILFHLGRAGLTLPGRLNKLELNFKSVQNEVNNQLVQIQADAKSAFDQTKVEKEQMESVILKGKRARDSRLAATRKKFKKLNQEGQDREPRTKKRTTNKNGPADWVKLAAERANENSTRAGDFWEKFRQFRATKNAMDQLRDQMCVNEPKNIAPCFEKQIKRYESLTLTVDTLLQRKDYFTTTLDQAQNVLTEVKQSHQDLVFDTLEKRENLELMINEIRGRGEFTGEILQRATKVFVQVNDAIDHLRRKILSSEWISGKVQSKLGIAKTVDRTVAGMKLTEMTNVDDTLNVLILCGDKLQDIIKHMETKSQEARDELYDTVWADKPQDTLAEVQGSGPNNTRIIITDDEDIQIPEDFLCDDDDANDEYLSRDQIKLAMRNMSENATARRKRKRGPKK